MHVDGVAREPRASVAPVSHGTPRPPGGCITCATSPGRRGAIRVGISLLLASAKALTICCIE